MLVTVIVFPLLTDGYIFALDMVWYPEVPFYNQKDNLYFFHYFLWLINLLLPSALIQKLILSLTLIIAWFGIIRLVSLWTRTSCALYFAGVFYLVNPYVYTRLLNGHYLLLIGYALLPWFVFRLFCFLHRPNVKSATLLVLTACIIGWASIHTLGFIALISFISLIAICTARGGWARRIFWSGAAASVWVLMNYWWLNTDSAKASMQTDIIGSFNGSHLTAFKTTSDSSAGLEINAIGLYGFWADNQLRYYLPKFDDLWLIPLALLMTLVLIGIWKSTRLPIGWVLVSCGLISWVLGMGIAWPYGAWLTQALIDYIPYYRGYREPQKWLMILALSYAVLGSIGVAYLAGRKDWLKWAAKATVLLPILYVPTMVWGLGGQLKSTDYPKDWYTFKSQLEEEAGSGKVVALPWHQYIELGFVGRTVNNPSPGFFSSRDVVSSNDPEIPGIEPINRSIEQIVYEDVIYPKRFDSTNVGLDLAKIEVEYITLFKESDWRLYGWLNNQLDLEIVSETSNLKIYRNKSYEGGK